MRIFFVKDVTFDIPSFSTSIGDAIVVKDGYTYKFYIHKSSGIELVNVTRSIKLIEGYHGINTIFDKKDLQARYGDAIALQFFKDVFRDNNIKSFFQTAYNILKFNEERWECDVLTKLYAANMVEEPEIVEKDFQSYLPDSINSKLDVLLENGLKKSDALRQIKNEHTDEFMRAFTEFKKDYPLKSILDD